MSVASSRGSPCLSDRARSTNRATNSSRTDSSTNSLVPDRHTCPALSYCSTALATARSRSASANTMNGDLPPSSSDSGVRLAAAALAMIRAVGTDPVKEIRRTPGWATSAAPASSPYPCTTLSTPSGRPASAAMSHRSEAVSGDHSDGFSTTVSPAASAGAIFQVASMSGAFHGEISAQTPAGSQETWLRCPRVSKSGWPSRWTRKSAKNRKLCATRGMTPRRCERISAPLSVVSTTARSSRRFSTPAAIRRSTRARSAGAVAAHPGKAASAARTAASASALPPRATRAMTPPSIGE